MLKQDKISSENMSSNERMLRHGELRLLKNLRKEHQRAAPRKRSYLKYDPHEVRNDELDGDGGQVDIKDVEFRIRNDASQVKVRGVFLKVWVFRARFFSVRGLIVSLAFRTHCVF